METFALKIAWTIQLLKKTVIVLWNAIQLATHLALSVRLLKEMCPSKTGKNSKEFLMKQFYEKKFPSTFIRGLKHKSSRQIIAPLILFVYPTLQF